MSSSEPIVDPVPVLVRFTTSAYVPTFRRARKTDVTSDGQARPAGHMLRVVHLTNGEERIIGQAKACSEGHVPGNRKNRRAIKALARRPK